MSFTALTNEYQSHIHRKIIWILLALVILIILAAAAVCIGVADLTPARLAVTWLPLSERYLDVLPLTPKEENVLLLLRLPRVAAAVIAGAGLGLAGTGMQAITGNQMASPFTTGLSGAAALGAAAVIIFSGIPVYFQKTAMVTAAFLMALICAVFVYGLSSLKGLGAETLVLTGIALNYFFSALNSTMQFIANEQQLPAIVHWTFGSLTAVGWSDIAVMTVILFITIPIFQSQAWAFNIISSGGDESAGALGIHVKRTRILTGGCITVLTASIVSFTGIIGFVGLVAPHMARMVIGGDHRLLLPLSAITGAALVLAADTIGRCAFSPTTIPVGIVVSYVGVPLFLYLIIMERREGR